ncbi:MAG: hypothetical protein ABIO29_02015 [Sphingomicrobium sp.]
MIFTLASLIVLILSIVAFRWITDIPLMRTISASIDQWADSTHGNFSDPLAK